MKNDLIVLEKPTVPAQWDYQKSIEKTKQMIYKWQNMTQEIANELWIARELLALSHSEAADVMHGTKVPRNSWSEYCSAIGSSRRVVNRWLKRWFPEPKIEQETPSFLPGKFAVIYADPP